jgi:hypothetical protein
MDGRLQSAAPNSPRSGTIFKSVAHADRAPHIALPVPRMSAPLTPFSLDTMRRPLIPAAVLLLIAFIAPGESLSYVGCWRASSFAAAREPAASLAACEESCAVSKLPLVGLVSRDLRDPGAFCSPRLGCMLGGTARARFPPHRTRPPAPARSSRARTTLSPRARRSATAAALAPPTCPWGRRWPTASAALAITARWPSTTASRVSAVERGASTLAQLRGRSSLARPSQPGRRRAADATKGCRVAPAPLSADNWQAGGTGAQYVKYTGVDEVQLTLVQDRGPRWALAAGDPPLPSPPRRSQAWQPCLGGGGPSKCPGCTEPAHGPRHGPAPACLPARINTLDKTGYGLYQAQVKACNQPGCITAFYVGAARRCLDSAGWEGRLVPAVLPPPC